MTTVTVAVPTYRRPQRLAHALPLLLEQAAGADTAYVVSVLVVDNDPQKSAADVCQDLRSDRVRYVNEPRPGISSVRNRALSDASTDLLAFIDDDEHPQPGWLDGLLQTWERTRAAAVGGRVVSVFEAPPGEWVQAGEFWQRPSYVTGSEVPVIATGNMLLDLRQVNSAGVRFSEAFGLTGGEDTHFSGLLRRSGLRVVWCHESVAIDTVPRARATPEWLLQRSLSVGNGQSRVELDLADGLLERNVVRMTLIAKGAARVALGGLRVGRGVVTGSLRDRARGARTLRRGVGNLTGACGWTYCEYARSTRRWAPPRLGLRRRTGGIE